MTPWQACTLNGLYHSNTGIVHTELLSETSIYDGIVWKSPDKIHGNVTFIGAGVTRAAYGPFSVIYET